MSFSLDLQTLGRLLATVFQKSDKSSNLLSFKSLQHLSVNISVYSSLDHLSIHDTSVSQSTTTCMKRFLKLVADLLHIDEMMTS